MHYEGPIRCGFANVLNVDQNISEKGFSFSPYASIVAYEYLNSVHGQLQQRFMQPARTL